MTSIIVKNSCIVLEDYTFNSCKSLENFFSIYDPITHQCFYKGLYYDEEKKKLYLPRGLDIWYIEKILNLKARVLKDSYYKFDRYYDIKIKYFPRDDDQKKALRFMLGKGEYLETQTKSQLSVNLNTGKGKTYVSIATIAYTGIKSIIITYSKSVLNQWKKCICEYTNITNREIFEIEGSGSIYRLLNKSEAEIKKIKIFLVSHSTIRSYAESHGWESIGELFKYLRIGLKFFDESHQNFDNMCNIDFFTSVYKSYYITATPARSNPDENRIYQTAFKNVLAIDLFHQDSDPHTKYIALRYSSKPAPYVISNCKGKYGLDRNKYTNYIVDNENFKKMAMVVMDLVLKIAKEPEDKILIYIGTNEAISKFYSWILENFQELKNQIGIFTSIVSAEDKKISLQRKIILTTTKSAGAAIDIKGLKVTVVLAEPFKSEVLARQTLGRTRDPNTFYIDVVDKGFYYCNKYFSAKKPIFNTYASGFELIDIDEFELDNRYNKILKGRDACSTRIDLAKTYNTRITDTSQYTGTESQVTGRNKSVQPIEGDMVKPFIVFGKDEIVKPFEFQ